MQLCQGNIWDYFNPDDQKQLLIFPANGVITATGHLVMGAGLAKEVKLRFPNTPFDLASMISTLGQERRKQGFNNIYKYGYVSYNNIGALQTKSDWRNAAHLELIEYSLGVMNDRLKEYLYDEIHMAMPGVGYGGLSREDVIPLLRHLSDKFHIWEFE